MNGQAIEPTDVVLAIYVATKGVESATDVRWTAEDFEPFASVLSAPNRRQWIIVVEAFAVKAQANQHSVVHRQL